MNKVLKVGIIGQGYWGPKLTRNFIDLLGVESISVADLKAERLAEIKNHYPQIKTTQAVEDLFNSDIDALVIATPVHTHYELALKALEAGKHVLVEKPITNSAFTADKLVELARGQGLTLMVGHTYEYNAAVEAIRGLVQSGALGQLFYVYSKRVNLGLLQPDINVMWDLAPHDLSILCFVLGEYPDKVLAIGENFVNKTNKKDEIVFMNLRFPSGVLANIRLSWLDPVKQRSMTVIGSQKMLVYDDIADDKVVLFEKGVDVPPYSLTMNEFQASYRHGAEEVYPFEWVEPLRSECEDFIDSIINGHPPRSSGEDGLNIVRILESAQRSLVNGGVELNVEY